MTMRLGRATRTPVGASSTDAPFPLFLFCCLWLEVERGSFLRLTMQYNPPLGSPPPPFLLFLASSRMPWTPLTVTVMSLSKEWGTAYASSFCKARNGVMAFYVAVDGRMGKLEEPLRAEVSLDVSGPQPKILPGLRGMLGIVADGCVWSHIVRGVAIEYLRRHSSVPYSDVLRSPMAPPAETTEPAPNAASRAGYGVPLRQVSGARSGRGGGSLSDVELLRIVGFLLSIRFRAPLRYARPAEVDG